MKFSLAVPDFSKAMKGIEEDLATAITAGMRDATNGLKQDLRNGVLSAGLGPRVANAWRGKTYPQGQNSLSPSAFVYTNAGKIVEAFGQGVVIRSRRGRFLAIPTEFAGKGSNGQHMTPEAWEADHGAKLQFIKAKNGRAFLIAQLRLRGGKQIRAAGKQFGKPTAASLKSGRGLTSVIVFLLVPSARIGKRFDVGATATDWGSRVPGLIESHWKG